MAVHRDMESDQEKVTVKPWIRRGGMLLNAECLDHDDPDHIYNQILSQGKQPEDYGIPHPLALEFNEWSRDELIREIVRLRSALRSREMYL
jgi:hypothetical protein